MGNSDKSADALELVDDEPTVDAFRDALCERAKDVIPRLADIIRRDTAEATDWAEVLLLASLVVAREEEYESLESLIGELDGFLRSCGIEPVAGSEHCVDVPPPHLAPHKEVVNETQENIYRTRLYVACEGVVEAEKRRLLLTTHPLEKPFNVGLYNIAVIWVSQRLLTEMDTSTIDAQSSQAAKKREKKRLEELAKAQAVLLLQEKGVLNPAN